MTTTNNIGYYTISENTQFHFVQLPMELITNPVFNHIPMDAKVIYSLMLFRMHLSTKNGWIDEMGRVYIIFRVEDVMEYLNCKKDKALEILKILDNKTVKTKRGTIVGAGLIERKRRGLGQPDIIFIKKFTDFLNQGNSDLQKSENPTSGDRNIHSVELDKTDPKYHDMSKKSMSQTPSYPSTVTYSHTGGKVSDAQDDVIDEMDSNAYTELIKENTGYDAMQVSLPLTTLETFNELVHLVCDVVTHPQKSIKIHGIDYNYETVKSRFLKLNQSHLLYVCSPLADTSSNIRNIRNYMLTALYNAPDTIKTYHQQMFNHFNSG